MRKTFRYRLNPNRTQTRALASILELCCDLYNEAKCLREMVYKTSKKGLTYPDQCLFFKDEEPYQDLYAQVRQDVLHRLDKTFKMFFHRTKKGGAGYPRYKSLDRYDSFTYPQYPNHGFKLQSNKLHLSRIGHIKINLHRPIEGKIKTLTIKRQCGKWYALFSCDVESKPLPPNSNEIGIDLGLMSFIATSRGEVVKNPRHFKKSEKKLKTIQQSLSKKKRGSKRRYKTKIQLRKAHEKIRNQRNDFQHKLARRIINENGTIAIEDLNTKQMIENGTTTLSKSIVETAWQSFVAKLIYKAEEAGRIVVKVNPKHTSQICLCGAKVPKDLTIRKHTCKKCGLVEDRDIVSAKIILQRARVEPLKKLQEVLV